MQNIYLNHLLECLTTLFLLFLEIISIIIPLWIFTQFFVVVLTAIFPISLFQDQIQMVPLQVPGDGGAKSLM